MRVFNLLLSALSLAVSSPSFAERNVISYYELSDWQDSTTGTTASLSEQCDILYEGRLIDGAVTNYFFLNLRNKSHSPKYLRESDVSFAFSTGRERLGGISNVNNTLKLDENINSVIRIEIPNKQDFKDATSVVVTVPVLDPDLKPVGCSLTVSFTQNTAKPRSEESYTSYSHGDFVFAGGSSLFRNKLSNVGSNGFVFNFSIEGYVNAHHGYFLDLGIEKFNNPNYGKLSEAVGNSIDTSTSITGNLFSIGYVHRSYLTERFQLSEKIGAGIYQVAFGNTDQYGSFAASGQIALDYNFPPSHGLLATYWGLGIAFSDIWVPNGTINKKLDYSGQTAAWLIRLKWGL